MESAHAHTKPLDSQECRKLKKDASNIKRGRSMFRRCPSCKRLFQAEEVKREQLGNPYEVQVPGGRGIPKFVRVENFRITYKCKSCGHEWTDVSEKTLRDHLYLHKL
jgi:hypothetical protein